MKTLRQLLSEAKTPKLIPVEEFKKTIHLYRGASLAETGSKKQIYHADVPKGHPYHKRPWVLKSDDGKGGM